MFLGDMESFFLPAENLPAQKAAEFLQLRIFMTVFRSFHGYLQRIHGRLKF
jgi:hypothetical protein